MVNNDILSKIQSSMPFLSKSEKQLGSFILENPKKVIQMSTNELSTTCGTSEPTLIRFTRKLGFSGYKEFKLQLSANIGVQTINSTPAKVKIGDSPFEIYEKLTSFTIASLNGTLTTLNKTDLEMAANFIYLSAKNHHQIFLSGMGASTILAREFQIKMMRLNIPTIFFEDIHLRLEACTNLCKNDLFICFTTLGSSTENYELIEIARKNKAKIIVITQYGNTRIAEKADITLYTSVIENNLRLASQTSIVIQSMVIDAIFLTIALKDFDKISKNVEHSKQLFKDTKHII